VTTGAVAGGDPVADVEVDARGRLCPLPVIELAKAAADAPAGTLLRLLADDPAAGSDVAAWCRMRGHELVSATDSAFLLRLSAAQYTGDSDNASASRDR
jgi:TusA-related sulfurtransferase